MTDTVNTLVCYCPIFFSCPFSSSLRSRPAFRFAMLCLFYLQLTVFIPSSSLCFCYPFAPQVLFLVYHIFTPPSSSLCCFRPSPSSSLAWIGFLCNLCIILHISPSTHRPRALASYSFVSREVSGLYFRNRGAHRALRIVRRSRSSVVA